MQPKEKKCFNCKFFLRYYTMGRRQFHNAKCGWCNSNLQMVKEHSQCDNFLPSPNRSTINEDAKKTLNHLLSEISTIRKMMEAEIENGKDV